MISIARERPRATRGTRFGYIVSAASMYDGVCFNQTRSLDTSVRIPLKPLMRANSAVNDSGALCAKPQNPAGRRPHQQPAYRALMGEASLAALGQ